MPIMRSRSFCSLSSRNGRRESTLRDETKQCIRDNSETTVSVALIQFIFAYNYSDNKENGLQKADYKPIL